MANHVRQQIREAMATLLTGLTTTATRVYQSRIYPLEDIELPCLLISTNQEAVTNLDVGINPTLERELTITVTAVAKGTTNLDDTLDTMVKEVEAAINVSATTNSLSGLVENTALQSIDIEITGDAEKPTGHAVMSFNATYYTRASAPDVSV